MDFSIGIACLICGIVINRLALRSSRQKADLLAVFSGIVFMASFLMILFFTNARPPGAENTVGFGLRFAFWSMAMSAGLTWHRWTFQRM